MSSSGFYVDENGNIVSSDPDFQDGFGILDEPDEQQDSLYDELQSSGTVSGSDVFVLPDPVDYTDSFSSLEEPLAYLASEQASSSGYLSSSCLDAFDRVVEGYAGPYYCAFRNSNDTYNGVLYISEDADSSGGRVVMKDALKIELYRTQTGSGSYNYQYYYSKSNAGDVEINFGNNLMYYTNCLEGYPLLAGIQSPAVKEESFFNEYFYYAVMIGIILLLLFLLFGGQRSA